MENHLKALADFDEAAPARSIPAGFIDRPRDIGRLAIRLASDDAHYFVGQTLTMDGGQGAIMPLTGDFREPRKDQCGRGYGPGL